MVQDYLTTYWKKIKFHATLIIRQWKMTIDDTESLLSTEGEI